MTDERQSSNPDRPAQGPPSAQQPWGQPTTWGQPTGPPGSAPPGQPPSNDTTRKGVLVVIGVVLVVLILWSLDQGQGDSTAPTGTAIVTVQAPGDLCWSGAFGDRTVDGCGPSKVPVTGLGGIYSANAQKQDDSAAELTLVLTIDGREVDRTSTAAAYGVASVMGQG